METKRLERKLNTEYRKLDNLKVNHILHLLISLFTGGLWIIAWILITMSVNSQREELELEINNIEQHIDTGEKPKRKLDIGERIGRSAVNSTINIYKKITNK